MHQHESRTQKQVDVPVNVPLKKQRTHVYPLGSVYNGNGQTI